MSQAATISSREFSHLFWTPQGRGFDLNLDFAFNPKTAQVDTKFTIPVKYQGGPGAVHGGIVAAIMDEGQGALCYHLGHFVMTDKLTMEYKKKTPVDTEVHFEARVSSVRKRKLYTRATISDGEGNLLVISAARWYVFNYKMADRMLPLQYSDEDWNKMQAIMNANRERRKELKRTLPRGRRKKA